MHIGHAGGPPGRAVFVQHALDRQNFEQRLQPPSAHAGIGFDLDQAVSIAPQAAEHLFCRLRVGNRGGGEVIPNALIRIRRQQHPFGMRHCPARPPHLLVISHRRRGRAHMHTKAQVGFVVAHAQRRGGHHRLDLVVAQTVFHLQARVGVGLPAVGIHRMAAAAQKRREPLGLGHRQHIHNARARQLLQRIGNPGVALQGRQTRHHRQRERGAGQRAAKRDRGRAQLLANI